MDERQHALGWRVRLPEHVVLREFPEETVVLNLDSGMYHGLNRTAAEMLEAVRASGTVRDAIPGLAETFGQPAELIEADVVKLCHALRDRGLIVTEADDGA